MFPSHTAWLLIPKATKFTLLWQVRVVQYDIAFATYKSNIMCLRITCHVKHTNFWWKPVFNFEFVCFHEVSFPKTLNDDINVRVCLNLPATCIFFQYLNIFHMLFTLVTYKGPWWNWGKLLHWTIQNKVLVKYVRTFSIYQEFILGDKLVIKYGKFNFHVFMHNFSMFFYLILSHFSRHVEFDYIFTFFY